MKFPAGANEVKAFDSGGRGYDMPAVEEIQREAAKDNYRLRSILIGIIKSYPFRNTRTS